MDAKVGGTYKMSFTNFATGHSHSFGGEYCELVPFEKIRYLAPVASIEKMMADATNVSPLFCRASI